MTTRALTSRGFTLVELMATVLIASILMALAVPTFRVLSQNSAQRNAISDLNILLSKMRTEVATRNLGVTACASADQATCSGTANWEEGWILFVEGTAPGYTANGTLDAGEPVVLVHEALPGGATLRTLGPAASITLRKDGTVTAQATFRYCDDRGMANLRAVVFGAGGLSRQVLDGNDHTGTAIASCT